MPEKDQSVNTRFFAPNLERRGRQIRAVAGLGLMAAAVYSHRAWLVAVLLAISGGFVLVEAWRGWCALRACGIKTKF